MNQQTNFVNANLLKPRSSVEQATIEERRRDFREARLPTEFDGGSLIRLANVREALSQKLINVYDAPELHNTWVNQDEAIVIEREIKGKMQVVGVKCAKRGNDVYCWRLNERLKDVKALFRDKDIELFDSRDINPEVNVLYMTLTYDTKRLNVSEAWKNIGIEYNKYVSFLKRRYGDISILRCWEAYENGYPHVHMIVVFNEHHFTGFKHNNDDVRIQEKDEVSEGWHSFVDISAVQTLAKSGFYLLKYISKVNNSSSIPAGEDDESKKTRKKHQLTLAMQWLFNKRSFGISGDFRKDYLRLESTLHNSNKKTAKYQETFDKLLGFSEDMKYANAWKLVGVYKWEDVFKVAKNGQIKEQWALDLKGRPNEEVERFDCPRNIERITDYDCRKCDHLLKCRLGGFEINQMSNS